MRVNSLIFYLNSKYEDSKMKELKETYLIDLVSNVAKRILNNNNIKTWSDIENKFKNENKDNRSAKEIEEDVLNKFKKLEEQG